MLLLLDTCAVLSFGLGGPIAQSTKAVLTDCMERQLAFFSGATIWELAQKEWLGKLTFAPDQDVRSFVRRMMAPRMLQHSPLEPAVMLEAYAMPQWEHRDPADRMIVATARLLDATLLTSDRAILAYAATGAVEAMPL